MQTRLLWRRTVTALGLYGGFGLGLLASVLAARQLGPDGFGKMTLAIFGAGFVQLVFDLTVEEVMIKYGFRYTTEQKWGRLRRLYRRAMLFKTMGAVFAAVVLALIAPFADTLFNTDGLTVPFLLAALLPITYIPESPAGAALVLTGRYDRRAHYNFLTSLLRAAGLIVGARYGVTEAVLGLVIGQTVGSILVSRAAITVFHEFPAAEPEPLGEDLPEIKRFVIRSSIGSGVVSLRQAVLPLLLGGVSNATQVGYFKAAQAPMTGLSGATAPARLILITEQTGDWERGSYDRVFASLRRYSVWALGVMLVAVPVFYWLMPALIRIAFKPAFEPSTTAARVMLFAGAITFVIAWTKSLPVSVGKPELRIVIHGIETMVLVPLVLWFGWKWGATGAAVAVLISTVVFACAWGVALVRLHRVHGNLEPA
jgi:O-antigen/teichoic acid export membrane protein